MEVEILTLCDFAQDYSGKMVISGTFDVIFAKETPAVHPICYVAARVRFSESEIGNHPYKIRIIDDKGKEIVKSLEGNTEVIKPNYGKYSSLNFVVQLPNLRLEDYGYYFTELYIDDELKSSLPFNLVLRK